MVSTDYLQVATEIGLYDPASGKPFSVRYDYYDIWHRTNKTYNSGVRLWRAYSILKPSGNWTMQQARDYPYSIKPDKLISTEDVYRILGDVNAGNAFDNTEDPNWYVQTKDGFKKSPLATPNMLGEMRDLLNVRFFRPIGGITNSYHFVGQARSWLPNEIGGMFWFGYDNANNSLVVPVWTGVNDTAPSWKVADRTKVNRNSAWWAFGLVDDEVNVMYGILKPILEEVRAPLQRELFDQQKTIEEEALKLYKSDPEAAKKYLTDYTISSMEKAEKVYWEVLDKLYYMANNNRSHGPTYLYPTIP
jgi:dipeptidase